MDYLQINARDNVVVTLRDFHAGEKININDRQIILNGDIPRGHKLAINSIGAEENVIKYGVPIGHATVQVSPGEHVHTHNLKTNLGELLEYQYQPGLQAEGERSGVKELEAAKLGTTFQGYRRHDGKVGIRNEIWVIPTVSCVNRTAEIIAKTAWNELAERTNLDGIYEFKHPYGCSQMGEDQVNTQQILADLINHPNAAGVLVLGLGCENSNVAAIKQVLGDFDSERVKFLVAQEVEDEIETGVSLIRELVGVTEKFVRVPCPAAELTIGLKCGGSDGLSGITANPLVGVLSDLLIQAGGTSLLTEVPEMFGAESILMNRAVSSEVFTKVVSLINDFKSYFMSFQQPIYENPSPGNKAGGISTLEDKSLGCTQKGGNSPVVDVLRYGEKCSLKGLNLLAAPGNDMVAATALAAAGAQIILFTTGRGTPLGTCVPTVKIATNSELYRRKPNWMDFDAGKLLSGLSMMELAEQLWSHVLNVAEGEKTKAEDMGFREIAIFKTGVTL
ncbi:MAG: altronate dehydratase family protein [Peptococcaceae bacterium]|nr:altronate dehydratase family protein [Peptococcaceae bacterium]